jgi:predicted O-methyltransferase YrrM
MTPLASIKVIGKNRMNSSNELTMQSSFARKIVFAATKALTSPRATISWIFRGHLAKDRALTNQMYWFTGALPRVPANEVFSDLPDAEVTMPRAFDRKSGTSISVEEACHLGAITRHIQARKVLEIGTYDGNSALVLAANVATDGEVVTVDLPPDFSVQDQGSLAFSEGEFNLTPRNELGRQYSGHALSARIRQVYGDSGKMDWSTLGGPFDLIFIDGCHTEDYVRSDTVNAMTQLRPGGVIAWHDYGMIPDVSRAVDRIAAENPRMKVCVLEGTRLAIGLT